MTTTYPSLATHAHTDPACPDLWDALRDVPEPEFAISVVDMGLIIAIERHEHAVQVVLTFTALGCPATEMISDAIRDRLLREPGIRSVSCQIVWDPIWTKARLTAEGIDGLRGWGVAA